MQTTTVLYHAQCPDGFAAAVAAWRQLGDQAGYIPVRYGEPMPRLADGGRIYILDFSYRRAELEALASRCEVTVLDHHQTAAAELRGLSFATFDLVKSGAVLAWEYFHGTEPPLLLSYIQDRDLWLWELPSSHEVSAGLQLVPRTLPAWSDLIERGAGAIAELVRTGRVALTFKRQLVDQICAGAHFGPIRGHRVPIVNSNVFQSEIGHELLERHQDAPFAAIYFDRSASQRVWSLRSRAEFDCSAIAQSFEGGGGHPQAAGFEEHIEPPTTAIDRM